jgi:hypothetical protein
LKAKLNFIGPIQQKPDGKQFREVGAEEFAGERKSAWKCAPEFDKYRVGDTVDVLLSDNGKYINAVRPGESANPTPGTGGTGYAKKTYSGAGKSAYQPDPEKNTSVYTSYVLEHVLDKPKGLTPEQAVALVMKVRGLVSQGLQGIVPKESLRAGEPVASVELGIKVDTALALVRQIHPEAEQKVWTPYIQKAILRAKGFDSLLKDLNACLAGEKILDYTPDGVPAFMVPGPV